MIVNKTLDNNVMTSNPTIENKCNVWHYKLVHPSTSVFNKLAKFPLLDYSCVPGDISFCSTCQLAKTHKSIFKSNHVLSSNAFNLLYIDLYVMID